MIDCDGCDAQFVDIDVWVAHVACPDGLCWRAAEARIVEILTDLRGSRINRSYAAFLITQMMKGIHELGVLEGKEI